MMSESFKYNISEFISDLDGHYLAKKSNKIAFQCMNWYVKLLPFVFCLCFAFLKATIIKSNFLFGGQRRQRYLTIENEVSRLFMSFFSWFNWFFYNSTFSLKRFRFLITLITLIRYYEQKKTFKDNVIFIVEQMPQIIYIYIFRYKSIAKKLV